MIGAFGMLIPFGMMYLATNSIPECTFDHKARYIKQYPKFLSIED